MGIDISAVKMDEDRGGQKKKEKGRGRGLWLKPRGRQGR